MLQGGEEAANVITAALVHLKIVVIALTMLNVDCEQRKRTMHWLSKGHPLVWLDHTVGSLCSICSNMSHNQFPCAALQDEVMDILCWFVCSGERTLLTV